MTAEIAFRVGSVLLAVVSAGFGIPAVIGAAHFSRTGRTWQLWGFPSYDTTLFERWGVQMLSPVALMVAFAVVCAGGVVAAVMLWIPVAATAGAIGGLVMLAGQAVFWIGFALPFGPPLGILAAIALVWGLALSPR